MAKLRGSYKAAEDAATETIKLVSGQLKDAQAEVVRLLAHINDNFPQLKFDKNYKLKPIKVVITQYEMDCLLLAAGNGYGDGEFFVDSLGGDTGYGGQRAAAAYCRAFEKLKVGVNLLGGEERDLRADFDKAHSYNASLCEQRAKALKALKELKECYDGDQTDDEENYRYSLLSEAMRQLEEPKHKQ